MAEQGIGNASSQQTQAQFVDRAAVHEAFAVLGQPIVNASPTVLATPPAPLAENPATLLRSGTNLQWISGYWSWHVELEQFVWITGLHREVPPGRRWVAGEWFEVPGACSL